MAIAFDASTTSLTFTTGDITINHTPVGTPKGVLVLITQGDTSDDTVTGVTYGGSALTEVGSSPHITTGDEAATLYAYFLGSSVPTGAQDAVVSTNASRRRNIDVITVTAANDTEYNTSSLLVESNSLDDPSATFAIGGVTSYVVEWFMSGQSAVGGVSPNTGWTELSEGDMGSQLGCCYSYDTIGSSDVTCGYTSTSADNVYLAAIAINEAAGGGGLSIPVAMANYRRFR